MTLNKNLITEEANMAQSHIIVIMVQTEMAEVLIFQRSGTIDDTMIQMILAKRNLAKRNLVKRNLAMIQMVKNLLAKRVMVKEISTILVPKKVLGAAVQAYQKVVVVTISSTTSFQRISNINN